MCEKEGFIPRFYIDKPNDKVDAVIQDLKDYTYSVMTEELNLGNLIESAVRQMAIEEAKEEDEDVDNLPFWDRSIDPEGELARLAVLPGEQNKGLGRIMLKFGMDELKRRGFKGIHFLVNRHNIKAIRCYEIFGFKKAGECHMYEQDFYCYELELKAD